MERFLAGAGSRLQLVTDGEKPPIARPERHDQAKQ
jgi:hypothetical protein